jgi:hypothetical protein
MDISDITFSVMRLSSINMGSVTEYELLMHYKGRVRFFESGNNMSLRVRHISDIDALKLSIKKWELIVDFLFKYRHNRFVFYDNGPLTCTLCGKYFFSEDYCKFCPVFIETGITECKGTPYDRYWNDENRKLFHAIQELKFLRRLLLERNK